MRGIRGKVALVTGGSSGIGLAAALRLREEGARVASLDIGPVPAAAPAEISLDVDVRDESAVAQAVAEVEGALGEIGILVNAAGVGGGGPVHLMPVEEWRRVVDVNLLGTFIVCKHVIASGLARNAEVSIVNVASIEGIHGGEGASSYSASKGGVVQLTRNIALDYARLGVRCNAVCPGFTDTPLLQGVFELEGMDVIRRNVVDATPMQRLCTPEEIASAIAFLASEDASFVTGDMLVVDGGLTAGFRIGITEFLGMRPDPTV